MANEFTKHSASEEGQDKIVNAISNLQTAGASAAG